MLVEKQWQNIISVPRSYIKLIITIFFYSIIMIHNHNPNYNYKLQSDFKNYNYKYNFYADDNN